MLNGPLTQADRAVLATLSPLGEVPPDTTNAVADDGAAAALGQQLFFDPRYAGPLKMASDLGAAGERGKVACVSCHWGEYLDDQRAGIGGVSVGADLHRRNALPAINSAFYRWTNWGGRFASQWELSLAVAESGVIMNGTRLGVAHLIFDAYRDEYEAIFGPIEPALGSDLMRFPPEGKPGQPAWDEMDPLDQETVNRIFVGFGKALQAYLRRLVSRDAPFDRFVAGDEGALTAEAQRGLALFIGRARCISCHLGPHLSDGQFHNTGVPQGAAPDEGRFGDVGGLLSSPFNTLSEYSDDPESGRMAGLTDPPPDETFGQFRTPSLRGVALTPPYMHSGQLGTLEAVIEFYDRGGDEPPLGERDPRVLPLGLSAQDKRDLATFLRTLTGAPVEPHLLERPPALQELDFELPPASWE